MAVPIDPLTYAILDALADLSDGDAGASAAGSLPGEGNVPLAPTKSSAQREGHSLPRIAKRTGLGASVVLRRLTMASDAVLGAKAGPGWVRVSQQDGHWRAALTDEGRRVIDALRAEADPGP